jgi:hypothetical protein
LRRILFQVGKLQFKLIEQRATLRGLPELPASVEQAMKARGTAAKR